MKHFYKLVVAYREENDFGNIFSIHIKSARYKILYSRLTAAFTVFKGTTHAANKSRAKCNKGK